MALTPEGLIKKDITDYINDLEKSGQSIHLERREAVGANYKKGIPDIYCIVGKYHLEIEVKAVDGELSTKQKEWRDKLRKWGTPYILADNLEDVKKELKEKFGIFIES